MNTVRVDGMRFVKETGKQLLIDGINVLGGEGKEAHV